MNQRSVLIVQSALKKWDRGTKSQRKEILQKFIDDNFGKTGPEIEDGFCQSASLFLTRVSSWLRMTYITGTCVSLQLKALQVFVTATAGLHFMTQFIEVGGICTLLEIIALKQSKPVNRTLSLKLLASIASSGRQYKELICECYGIRTIAECLAKSNNVTTQENCRHVMLLLVQGNPKYQSQVYKSFIALLPCSSPKAQQLSLQNLRISQKIVKQPHPNLVEPLLNLLSTMHFEVRYEAIEFIKEIIHHKEVSEAITSGLVKALRPSKEDVIHNPYEYELKVSMETAPKMKGPLPAYVKQSAAAKCIGILSRISGELAESFLQYDVIKNLMYACGNSEYFSSQREAAVTLEYLVLTFPTVKEAVEGTMGKDLFMLFMSDAEYFYTKLKPIQIDVLVTNKKRKL